MINKEKFIKYLNEKEINLKQSQINQFEQFKDLLIEWNEKINLTTIIEEDEILIKHFIDSLIPLKYIDNNSKVLDMGTGAGFPGIPTKIAKPDIKITLVDSVNKKITYLKDIVNKLELKNVELIHSRAENLAKDKKYRENYDIVISRALANMSTLSEYLIPFLKIGGKAIYIKGPNIEKELEESKKCIELMGGRIIKIEKYTLPTIDLDYNLVLIEKIKNTPKEYPRKEGIPSSKPIK